MTTTVSPAAATHVAAGNPWLPTWRGTALVARIEVMRRKPTRKGYIFYGALLGFIVLLSALAAAAAGPGKNSVPLELILIMVLGTGYLVGPSLSATAINGDSTEGVLAPMQMTRLTAGDLAFGKLIATWGITLVALATTVPFQLYAFSRAGWSAGELAAVIGVVLFLVLVATAIGLAWSSIAARNAVSVALTHVTSGFLGLGTLIIFAFSTPLVTDDVTVTTTDHDYESVTDDQWNDPNFDPSTMPCVTGDETRQWVHSERLAWLFLINPVIVIGESSPIIDPKTYEQDGRANPGVFAMIHQTTSDVRMGNEKPQGEDWCAFPDDGGSTAMTWEEREQAKALYPRAPLPGLIFYGVLGVLSMVLTVHRLRVPYRTLRGGTRVA